MTAVRLSSAAKPARGCVCKRGVPARAVKDVFMPALSSTMTEGKVVQWLKSEGDAVTKGEALVVVESDKADMDVESFEDGFLGAIVVDEGGSAGVGSPIAFIAESEGEIADAKAKAGSSSAAAPAAEAPKEVRCDLLSCYGCLTSIFILRAGAPRCLSCAPYPRLQSRRMLCASVRHDTVEKRHALIAPVPVNLFHAMRCSWSTASATAGAVPLRASRSREFGRTAWPIHTRVYAMFGFTS